MKLIFSNEHCEIPSYLNFTPQESLNENVKLINELLSKLVNINIINDKYDYVDIRDQNKDKKLKLSEIRNIVIQKDSDHMLSKILNQIYNK